MIAHKKKSNWGSIISRFLASVLLHWSCHADKLNLVTVRMIKNRKVETDLGSAAHIENYDQKMYLASHYQLICTQIKVTDCISVAIRVWKDAWLEQQTN